MPQSLPGHDILSLETLSALQASAAATLETAALFVRPDGQMPGPLSANGPFYVAMASFPTGADWLRTAAVRVGRDAARRNRRAVLAEESGLAAIALPVPGEDGPAGALVLFTSPGIKAALRGGLAAELGLPPSALPAGPDRWDPNRAAHAVRLVEQTFSIAEHAGRGKTGGASGNDAEARRDRVLYEASKALSRPMAPDDILREAAETLAGVLHMDHAAAYLLTGGRWEPAASVYYGGGAAEPAGGLDVDEERLAQLREGRLTPLPERLGRRERRVAVPILARRGEDLDAVVVLETTLATRPPTAADEDAALVIGRQAALAWRNACRAAVQTGLARTLQETLQSRVEPVVNGVSVQAFYRAAVQEANVGGDFYDVLSLSGGRVAVMVGDVAGKGVRAAIGTSLARYTLRAYAFLYPDPAVVLKRANEALERYEEFQDFLTIALVILDPARGVLHYASAGHCPAFLYRRGADAIGTLESTGTLLGIVPGQSWDTQTHKWGPGDALLMYTDGISEAHPPGHAEEFETTRVRRVFGQHRHDPPEEVLRAVFTAAETFAGGDLHDDCALLLVSQPSA